MEKKSPENYEPNKIWVFENVFPFQLGVFSGSMLVFWGSKYGKVDSSVQLSLEGICEVFGSGIWKYCTETKQSTSIGLVVLLPIKSGRLDYKKHVNVNVLLYLFFVASLFLITEFQVFS